MFSVVSLLSASFLSAKAVSAQQTQWGQCGGIGWTGPTRFSQCLPPPSTTSSTRTSSSSTSTSSTTVPVPTNTGNPFSGKSVWKPTKYASEVYAAAASVTDSATKAKISSVAQVPTFTWIDSSAKVADLPGYLTAASGQILQVVIYNLPNRDCHLAHPSYEFTYGNNGALLYQRFIDAIVATIRAVPGSTVVAIVEPKALTNLITQLNNVVCGTYATQYRASITYTLQALTNAGVYTYIDCGSGEMIANPAYIAPTATLFTKIWTDAGKSSYLRGIATNVAGYNALITGVTSPNGVYDELHYINALAPAIFTNGWDARFIVDQSRSGTQLAQSGTWCNRKNAGFGPHPSTTTVSNWIDAIVWVKPGGESDGTSNTASPRYESQCGASDAKIPAPEAGLWFQTYFMDLLYYANPPF
ncbi:cellulase [Serendipita vermifera]|nr:cellulase [Serendipita vermifera]